MKKRSKLTALAVLGINMGLLFCSVSGGSVQELTPEMRSFYEMLDPKAKKQFLELDQEHRRAAMSIMNQYCKKAHECRGLREKAVQEEYDDQMRRN